MIATSWNRWMNSVNSTRNRYWKTMDRTIRLMQSYQRMSRSRHCWHLNHFLRSTRWACCCQSY